MPATITGLVLAEGLMAAALSDTLSLTAPRSTAAELRFCSTRYQVCLNFQLELEPLLSARSSVSQEVDRFGSTN